MFNQDFREFIQSLNNEFESCYADKIQSVIDGVKVNFISLHHLKQNKNASGRHQDLADLENLT